MYALIWLLSCAEPEAPSPAPDPYAALLPLDAPRLLRRSSLDLRGVLPSAEELDAVAADPDQLGLIRASWFEDPRFQDRFVFQARYCLVGDGDETTRRVHGKLVIRAPVVGSAIEGWVSERLQASFDQEAQVVQDQALLLHL